MLPGGTYCPPPSPSPSPTPTPPTPCTVPQAAPTLSLTKDVDVTPVAPNSTATFTLVASAIGADFASASLVDVLPDGLVSLPAEGYRVSIPLAAQFVMSTAKPSTDKTSCTFPHPQASLPSLAAAGCYWRF